MEIEPYTFADADFLIGKAVKDKDSAELFLIIGVYPTGVENRSTIIPFDLLAKHCTFADGTPCGKEKKWEPEIPEIGEWAFFWDDAANYTINAIFQEFKNGMFYCVAGHFENCSKTPPPQLGGKAK